MSDAIPFTALLIWPSLLSTGYKTRTGLCFFPFFFFFYSCPLPNAAACFDLPCLTLSAFVWLAISARALKTTCRPTAVSETNDSKRLSNRPGRQLSTFDKALFALKRSINIQYLSFFLEPNNLHLFFYSHPLIKQHRRHDEHIGKADQQENSRRVGQE